MTNQIWQESEWQGEKHLADDSCDNTLECQCMPQLHYNKKKEDEEAEVKGENFCSVEGSKDMANYITWVQSPYVAPHCASYTELNVFFHTVNTKILVNNPCLQY